MRASAAQERELRRRRGASAISPRRAPSCEALRDEIRAARRREQQARRAPPAAPRRPSASATAASAPPRSGRRRPSARCARSTSRCRCTAPLAPGDPVEAPALGVRGTIAAIDGDEAEVVGRGGLRIRIPLARLRPDAHAARGGRASAGGARPRGARSDVSDELDVRGQPAQEAREAVRSFVDDAALAGLPSVRVIHGRGTGAVRTAVRDELTGHPLVERHETESADGATVAHLASALAETWPSSCSAILGTDASHDLRPVSRLCI